MLPYISNKKTKAWNPTAIDCYTIHCDCSKCYLNKWFFEFRNIKCHMKYYVIEMVKLFGQPPTYV